MNGGFVVAGSGGDRRSDVKGGGLLVVGVVRVGAEAEESFDSKDLGGESWRGKVREERRGERKREKKGGKGTSMMERSVSLFINGMHRNKIFLDQKMCDLGGGNQRR